MTLTTMYPGMVNSPEVTLTSLINDTVTTIEVTGSISKLPAAPNMFVIGTGEDAETVYYPTDAVANVFTFVTRGFQGVAKQWDAGTVISRNFTAYDYDTLRTNITTLNSPNGTITLMAAGAIVPVTAPAILNIGERSGGVNYIYGEFPESAANLQWIIEMPSGWDGGDITPTFCWTTNATGQGTKTVKWLMTAIRFDNDATLNTAFATGTDATDVWLAQYDYHEIAATAFTPSGSGNLIAFNVTRDYNNDDMTGTADLVAVKIKYTTTATY